jgi:hypothetical protein
MEEIEMYTKRKWLVGGIVLGAFCMAPLGDGAAQDFPEFIMLDSLTQLYEPVPFDHLMHLDVGSCADCHHHGTGVPVQDPNCARCHANAEAVPIVSCKSCHSPDPFSAADIREKDENLNLYHRDKPGLKGAYHLSCLGCHEEMGAPTGCNDCHVRTAEGEAFFRGEAW